MSDQQTFSREVTYLTAGFDGTNHVVTPVTKIVTFKELDSRDQDQHKLHFKIMSLYTSQPDQEDGEPVIKDGKRHVDVDTDKIYELTVAAIRKLVITDDTEFTKIDKQEFLADSKALLPFGMWFLTEKAFPFFHDTTPNSKT